MAETPKKAVGRPPKKPSFNDFCRVCGCNFLVYYGDFKRRVSAENLFEITKRAGVEKCRLVDLLSELGFTCEQSSSLSSRACEKCARKIRTTTELFRFFRGNLVSQTGPQSCSMKSAVESSPIASERFKRMARSPSNHATSKSSRLESSVEKPDSGAKSSKARRAINDGPGRSEIEKLVAVNETEKPQIKVVIPTGESTISLRSPPDELAERMVKNICSRNWKPVVNALFCHKDLKEEMMLALSKQLGREMTQYIQSDSMLKYSVPTELCSFSNRKLVYEVRVFCPLWFACITGAANVSLSSPGDLEQSLNPLALATAAIARHQNNRMSAYSKRVSTVLVHTGAKADDFTRLNRLGICTSHKQVIRDQLEMGSNHDTKVLM